MFRREDFKFKPSIMKIEMTDRELNAFSNNILKQVARFISDYCDETDECDIEKGVHKIEPDHLIEEVLSIKVDLSTLIQPKN